MTPQVAVSLWSGSSSGSLRIISLWVSRLASCILEAAFVFAVLVVRDDLGRLRNQWIFPICHGIDVCRSVECFIFFKAWCHVKCGDVVPSPQGDCELVVALVSK